MIPILLSGISFPPMEFAGDVRLGPPPTESSVADLQAVKLRLLQSSSAAIFAAETRKYGPTAVDPFFLTNKNSELLRRRRVFGREKSGQVGAALGN